MKYCSNCGTPLDEGSRFCPNCGQKLQESVAQTSQNEGTQMASEAPGEVVLSSWENPNPRPQQTSLQGGGYQPQGGNTYPQGNPAQTPPKTYAPTDDGKSKKKKKRGCGCFIAVVIVLAIAAAAAYIYYDYL